jgi:hypothetical protein
MALVGHKHDDFVRAKKMHEVKSEPMLYLNNTVGLNYKDWWSARRLLSFPKSETLPGENKMETNQTITLSQRLSKCFLVGTILVVIGTLCGLC